MKLLKKDKHGSPESLSKLPQMAKQLEVSLYRNARSFEAYMDSSTLKARLQQIAVEVSRKAPQMRPSQHRGDQRDERHWTERQSQQQPPPSHQQFNNGMRPPDTHMQRGNSSSPYPGQPMGSQRNPVNLDDINPMMNNNSSRGHSSSRTSSNDQSQRSSSGAVPHNRNDPEWKIRIRHKQQRLLLLHHSAKCPHEDGRCTVTPHCADMKRLWRHMEGCKDNNCRVSHCFSSRAILSHYRKCKDPNCPACGPVRDTVKKSQSKSSSSAAQQMMGSVGLGMPGSSMGSSMGGSSGSSSMQMPPMGNNNMGGSMGSSMPPNRGMSPGMSSSNQHPGMMNNDQMSPPNFGGPPTSSSYQQPSRSTMPPPSLGQSSSSSGMPYNSSSQSGSQSSRYRQPGSGPSASSSAPIYQDRPSSDSRGGSSASSSRMAGMNDASAVSASSSSGSGSKKNDSEWQKVRHKQQRLLLLRHASRCQYEAGKCPVTPHCASMKELWKHIAHCKDQQCSVQHCMSSRYVLSHYRRCKDPKCPACGPVRETIRKSHEKEKNLKQPQSSGPSFDGMDTSMPSVKSQRVDDVSSRQTSRSAVDSGANLSSAPPGPSPDYEREKKRAKTEPSPPNGAVSSMMPSSETKSADKPSSAAEITPKAQVKPESPTPKPTPGKSNADRSLLKSFAIEELEVHLASLNRQTQLPPSKLKSKCLEVLKGLQTHQHGWVFNVPVDPVELGLPDYFDIIKKPMDLGTIHKKLDAGAYHDIETFQADTNLTFDNAMTYNEEGSVVYDMAKELKTKFEADFKKLLAQLETEDKERRQNERACTLCGCEKLLFEPPVFFCNGMNCQSTRIRRNSHFYVGGNNQYFWCNQCYNELDDKIPIELVDMTITKADLKKKKNDEVHEESWVQCDSCERWVHQICGLFNTRQNKEHHSEYFCPQCLLEKRKENTTQQLPRPLGAEDLPRTALSEWLEQNIEKRVAQKKRELAAEKAEVEVSV